MFKTILAASILHLSLGDEDHEKFVQKLLTDFESEDINKDGFIDVAEAWNISTDEEEKKEIVAVFEQIDFDGDGLLSRAEYI